MDELIFDPFSYEAEETDCQDTLDELKKQPHLYLFLSEFDKLFKALKKGHESEIRLIQRCKILNADKKRAVAKIQAAMNIAIEDMSSIESFEREKETLQKNLEEAHDHSRHLKESCDQLEIEIKDRSKLLNIGPDLVADFKKQLNDLNVKKMLLAKERDEIFVKLNDLRKEQTDTIERNQSIKVDIGGLVQQIAEYENQYNDKKLEMDRHKQRKMRADEESKQIKNEINEINQLVARENVEAQLITQSINQMNETIAAQSKEIDGKRAAAQALEDQRKHADEELRKQKETVTRLRQENEAIQNEAKKVHALIQKTLQETVDAKRAKDRTTQSLRQTDTKRRQAEDLKGEKKNELTRLEDELTLQQTLNKDNKELIETYEKKLQLLQRKVVSNAQEQKKKEELRELSLMEKRFMESHIAGLKADLEKQKQAIEGLLSEKDKRTKELSGVVGDLREQQHVHQLKREALLDMQASVDERTNRLKQLQNMYEAVQTERNVGSRRLVKAIDANTELQHKFVTLEQEIFQLKEGIKLTDRQLLDENMKLDQILSATKGLRTKVAEYQQQIAIADETVASHKDQLRQLGHIIATSEQQVHREREEYKHVMGERAVLSGQLIQRDNELGTLYEKMMLQQATLEKGAEKYAEIVDKIEQTRERCIVLRSQLESLASRLCIAGQLKQECVRLDNDILSEKQKLRGMEDELKQPINAHRWRILDSVDPHCIDILNRIHLLQKRLIAVTDEVTEKNTLIEEKERLSAQLGELLRRQKTGAAEMKEQIEHLRTILKRKDSQLKAIVAELKNARDEEAGYASQISRLNEEVDDLKSTYIENMKLMTGY